MGKKIEVSKCKSCTNGKAAAAQFEGYLVCPYRRFPIKREVKECMYYEKKQNEKT